MEVKVEAVALDLEWSIVFTTAVEASRVHGGAKDFVVRFVLEELEVVAVGYQYVLICGVLVSGCVKDVCVSGWVKGI